MYQKHASVHDRICATDSTGNRSKFDPSRWNDKLRRILKDSLHTSRFNNLQRQLHTPSHPPKKKQEELYNIWLALTYCQYKSFQLIWGHRMTYRLKQFPQVLNSHSPPKTTNWSHSPLPPQRNWKGRSVEIITKLSARGRCASNKEAPRVWLVPWQNKVAGANSECYYSMRVPYTQTLFVDCIDTRFVCPSIDGATILVHKTSEGYVCYSLSVLSLIQ